MNESRIIPVRTAKQVIKRVLYLMHNAYRVKNNHALFHARSFDKNLTICILNPLDTHQRTLRFFEKGIKGYQETLSYVSQNVIRLPREEIPQLQIDAHTHIVMDMAYLKEERELYHVVLDLCDTVNASFDLVETNTFVPVTEASNKEEYSARTIRTKIHNQMKYYYDEVNQNYPILNGEKDALEKLRVFKDTKLQKYHLRNHPNESVSSELSGYLKFGFISPLTIVQAVQDIDSENKSSFLEELIVRRELAYNFVYYNASYNQFDSMTYNWAYHTMDKHKKDAREYLYNKEDYITYKTHDEYFNAAMKEMIEQGTMHGYMRMYWCKKIIEWSKTYEEAYDTALYLNNHYFIDGFSPNGYAGVAWCFGKHDRAWTERPIFGKLRYMNKKGLDRKFDMSQYLIKVQKGSVKNETC